MRNKFFAFADAMEMDQNKDCNRDNDDMPEKFFQKEYVRGKTGKIRDCQIKTDRIHNGDKA